MATLQIFTTGGTIDKVYFDALSEFQVGESGIGNMLAEANISYDYVITPLMKKDSLDLTDADRDIIYEAILDSRASNILVTHGTDTMAVTARHVSNIKNIKPSYLQDQCYRRPIELPTRSLMWDLQLPARNC